ncbi:MAG TPA: hypothetical protein PKZ42_04135 [Syntrophales bacterium]|nr:hypothetical protein [Syntrophales bacterium]
MKHTIEPMVHFCDSIARFLNMYFVQVTAHAYDFFFHEIKKISRQLPALSLSLSMKTAWTALLPYRLKGGDIPYNKIDPKEASFIGYK